MEPSIDPSGPGRTIRHEHTLNWAPILSHLGAALLISTYQAGKVVVVGVDEEGRLALSYHNFDRAMGVAVGPGRLAVGARAEVWFLREARELGPRVAPLGRHDTCYLARSAQVTGPIQGHEMAWLGDDLWVVNTAFSCLCTLDGGSSFVPRWRPPFITGLSADDRCHLNGLAVADGRPRYVTALAESDAAQGWRENKGVTGCLIDVPTGETVVRGLAMPHSPRVDGGRAWVLESGRGRLLLADPSAGTAEVVAELPGYTRGLALGGGFAFVGLSKIRETSTFGGVPIADRREALRCGIAAIELSSGRPVGLLEFHSGVEEIFDVQLLAGARLPAVSGPYPHLDGTPPIWTVGAPRATTGLSGS